MGSDPERQNPFHPFTTLDPDLLRLAPKRQDVVSTVLRLTSVPTFPAAVLAGSSGVGKSTIVRSILPAALADTGRSPVHFTGSPSLTAQQIGTDVAIALGFSDRRYTRIYDEIGGPEQSVGDVDQSQRVKVTQAVSSVRIEGQFGPNDADLAARLDALTSSREQRVAVIVDQVEQLFLPSSGVHAIGLLEQLLRCALLSEGRVAVIMAVRDRYLYEIIQLAASFPGLSNRIVPVHGLNSADAREFIEAGLSWYGADFSKRLYDRLIARLQGTDGRVWPVALHACCRPLAEVSRRRKRPASTRDLEQLGDLSGVLARAVSDELATLNADGTGDALFVLASVSSVYRSEGPVSIDDLVRLLPSYPPVDLEQIVNALVGLRLLERDRSGSYRPSHDSIGTAVAMLRATPDVSDATGRLDDAVTRWSKTGRIVDVDELPMQDLLRVASVPTPHLIFLATLMFQRPGDENLQILLAERLRQVPENQLVRLVWLQARREGRLRSLGPSAVYTLMLDERRTCVIAALDGIRAAALGPDIRWLSVDYQLAITRSGGDLRGDVLRECGLETWPAAAFRVVLRKCIAQERLDLDADVLNRWWRDGPMVLRTDLLQLAARHAPAHGRALISESLELGQDYLRAAAVEAASTMRVEGWSEYVVRASRDQSVLVRRRAAYLLSRLPEETGAAELELMAASDPSSFVREAAVECMGEIALARFSDVVTSALSDTADIVRESAVYALRHIVGAAAAGAEVEGLLGDGSPHVREAVLRVLSLANRSPDPSAVVADLRADSESLRAAAIDVLVLSDPEFAAPLLSDILARPATQKSTTIGALRAVAAGKFKSATYDLARVVTENEDAEVLCEAALALQAIGGSEASELLCSLVFHPSADVRERAVYALAEVGGTNAANVLMSSLYDPISSIQVRAVYGLARLRVHSAREAIRMIRAVTPELDKAIEYFLREIGSQHDFR